MKKVIVEVGYSFVYNNTYHTGSVANINNNQNIEIVINEIGSKYHCALTINGVFIQIWCTEFKVTKIEN